MTGKLKGGVKFTATLILVLAACGAKAALVTNAAQAITDLVTVQPIILSDDGGANMAEFFGSLAQQTSIEGLIDSIWAQAGIDVDFLAPNAWNSSSANQGIDSLFEIVGNGITAGVTNPNPNIINIFFVNIVEGFGLLPENSVAGRAFVGGNGVVQYVGTTLLSSLGGREGIASVVAHEIGHNLDLPHIVNSENLMQAGGAPNEGERLIGTQISTALASNLSVSVVPLPAAVWMLLSGLLSITAVRRLASSRAH
jgi:hypothetical protein